MLSSTKRRRAALRAIGFAVVAALAACQFFNSSASSNANLQQLLTDSENAWAAAAIHNYEFDYLHTCGGCSGDSVAEVHVVVRNDVVSAVTLNPGGGTPAVPKSVFPAVPGIFALMQSALTTNTSLIAATFNTAQGYPVFLQIIPKSNAASNGNIYVTAAFKPDTL